MTSTQNFEEMSDKDKGCRMEARGDCERKMLVQKVSEMCQCVPFSLLEGWPNSSSNTQVKPIHLLSRLFWVSPGLQWKRNEVFWRNPKWKDRLRHILPRSPRWHREHQLTNVQRPGTIIIIPLFHFITFIPGMAWQAYLGIQQLQEEFCQK